MAGEAVVRFIVDGTGKAIQQANQVKDAFVKMGKAGANAAGQQVGSIFKGSTDRQTRTNFGKLGVFAGQALGQGAFGQLGAAMGAPTRGLAAIGVAAVGLGMALGMLNQQIARSIAAVSDEVKTRHASTATIAGSVTAANQSALSSTLGRREELIGGDKGSAELRKLFATADAISSQKKQTETERALKFGEGEMRADLARTRSPEAAAQTELYRTASNQLIIQTEIRDKLGFFQAAYQTIMNGGRRDADWKDAARNLSNVSGTP